MMNKNGFEGWDLLPDGQIALGPLLGWKAATAPMTGLLRLESAQTEEGMQKGEVQSLQLAMTAQQMRELAQLLNQIAQYVEDQPLGPSQ